MFEKILEKAKDWGKIKPKINVPSVDAPAKEIKIDDVDRDIRNRISRVRREIHDGLSFVKKTKKSVTVFGSARFEKDHPYYEKARNIGHKLAEEGIDVITGGGPGEMQGANHGAFESKGPGKSYGFNIELPHEQILNPYVHDHVTFYYFFTRKLALTFSAEAYIYFPGGLGTLDEFFEIMTLVQTRKIPRVPIICVGEDFWGSLASFMKTKLVDEYKTIDESDLDLFVITDDEDFVVDIVKNAPLRNE